MSSRESPGLLIDYIISYDHQAERYLHTLSGDLHMPKIFGRLEPLHSRNLYAVDFDWIIPHSVCCRHLNFLSLMNRFANSCRTAGIEIAKIEAYVTKISVELMK